MKLYRGLKEPYCPEKVGGRHKAVRPGMFGTDFTDCPYAALQYAQGRRGAVLVVDVWEDDVRITRELWTLRDDGPKRLMVWGKFDNFIVAEIPAKELRKHVRRKGVVAEDDEYKAYILTRAIDDWIAEHPRPDLPVSLDQSCKQLHEGLQRAFRRMWMDERRRETLARIVVHERQFENWWKFEVASHLWDLAEQLGVNVWIEADSRADVLLAHARPRSPQRFDPARNPRVPIELKTVGTFWKNPAKAYAETSKKRLVRDMDDAIERRASGRATPFAIVGLLATHVGASDDDIWNDFLEYPRELAHARGLVEVVDDAVSLPEGTQAQQMLWRTP